MNIFAKIRFTHLALVVLVLLNLGSLSALWLNHKGPHPPRPPHPPHSPHGGRSVAAFLERELDLSKAQREAFKKLRDAHHQAARALLKDMREQRQAFFDLLGSDTPDQVKMTALSQAIGHNQAALELATFNHFNQLRTLCDTTQKPIFDRVVHEALRMMAPKPPPRRH